MSFELIFLLTWEYKNRKINLNLNKKIDWAMINGKTNIYF